LTPFFRIILYLDFFYKIDKGVFFMFDRLTSVGKLFVFILFSSFLVLIFLGVDKILEGSIFFDNIDEQEEIVDLEGWILINNPQNLKEESLIGVTTNFKDIIVVKLHAPELETKDKVIFKDVFSFEIIGTAGVFQSINIPRSYVLLKKKSKEFKNPVYQDFNNTASEKNYEDFVEISGFVESLENIKRGLIFNYYTYKFLPEDSDNYILLHSLTQLDNGDFVTKKGLLFSKEQVVPEFFEWIIAD